MSRSPYPQGERRLPEIWQSLGRKLSVVPCIQRYRRQPPPSGPPPWPLPARQSVPELVTRALGLHFPWQSLAPRDPLLCKPHTCTTCRQQSQTIVPFHHMPATVRLAIQPQQQGLSSSDHSLPRAGFQQMQPIGWAGRVPLKTTPFRLIPPGLLTSLLSICSLEESNSRPLPLRTRRFIGLQGRVIRNQTDSERHRPRYRAILVRPQVP